MRAAGRFLLATWIMWPWDHQHPETDGLDKEHKVFLSGAISPSLWESQDPRGIPWKTLALAGDSSWAFSTSEWEEDQDRWSVELGWLLKPTKEAEYQCLVGGPVLKTAAAPHCSKRSSRQVEDGNFQRANCPWVKAKGWLTSKGTDEHTDILPKDNKQGCLKSLPGSTGGTGYYHILFDSVFQAARTRDALLFSSQDSYISPWTDEPFNAEAKDIAPGHRNWVLPLAPQATLGKPFCSPMTLICAREVPWAALYGALWHTLMTSTVQGLALMTNLGKVPWGSPHCSSSASAS